MHANTGRARIPQSQLLAGMGLAVVNRILRLNRGVLRGESEPDEGITLYFTLPDGR